ncbi:unnamed protein product, partial [Symbiodinium sp. CCMP2456]
YFHAGEPATALARVPEEELQKREAGFGPLVQMHDQTPGECILIPDGHWHCTYNSTEHFTFGVGGMGRIGSVSEALAAEGDVDALRQSPAEVLQAEAPQLLSTSAEQGQLSVLKFLVHDLGARFDKLNQQDITRAAPICFHMIYGLAAECLGSSSGWSVATNHAIMPLRVIVVDLLAPTTKIRTQEEEEQ